MSEDKDKKNDPELAKIKDFIRDERFDDAVQIIALYLGDATDENYLDLLENLIETILTLHGGRTVLRFLIERLIIDLPSLLENLSKRDSVLRYSFLLLLKPLCENECDLFMPFIEDLINSEDPNIREGALQLIIFMAGGDRKIDDELLVTSISDKLKDEKEFIVEKAIQTLKIIGKSNPSLVSRILSNQVKDNIENEELKQNADKILKFIVSVDQIEDLVEEELTESEIIKKDENEIFDKELELKKKDIEIKKKKLELELKEKEFEEISIQEREKALKIKEKLLEKESELSQVEIEMQQKKIKEKEKKLRETELERAEEIFKELEEEKRKEKYE